MKLLLKRLKFLEGGNAQGARYYSKRLKDRRLMVYLDPDLTGIVCYLRFDLQFDREVCRFSSTRELEIAIAFQSLRPLTSGPMTVNKETR